MPDTVGRIDQYGSMLSLEFDEINIGTRNIFISCISSSPLIGTFFADEFAENVGVTTILTNVYRPYDFLTSEFAMPSFGPGTGTYMRHNTDKTVHIYNEIDEVTQML